MANDERRDAVITAPTSVLTRHFPRRDAEVRWALDALTLNDRGHAVIHLPTEMTEKIVKLIHGQEHRGRMASVFEQINRLPKCKACGSVSAL